jgi:hypothetical protein
MRQSFVVAVSAGDRHSVALTSLGEVYCWGDNRSGQLGMYSNNGDVGGGSSPVSGNRLGGFVCRQWILVVCICKAAPSHDPHRPARS